MFIEKKCDHCGKPFFPTKYHAYKEEYNDHVKWFCKYTCMLHHREQFKPPKPKPRKEQTMSRETRIVCDRCGEEIKYVGWTSKLPLARKRPTRFKLLKLFYGNMYGYSYSEYEYELCNKCTFELRIFLEGGKVVNEQRAADN